MNTVLFKRFDSDLPAPLQATPGAAAYDLYARETVTIEPHQVGKVPLNIAVKLPKGHWLLMSARSSLHKMGVMLANGIGVGDEDFSGDTDEYLAALLNFTPNPVTIERGDRIVQMMVMAKVPVELQEVNQLDAEARGGFGSTGKK